MVMNEGADQSVAISRASDAVGIVPPSDIDIARQRSG
jgi:hypothetical protein